jgi:hypothetical protein
VLPNCELRLFRDPKDSSPRTELEIFAPAHRADMPEITIGCEKTHIDAAMPPEKFYRLFNSEDTPTKRRHCQSLHGYSFSSRK